MNTVICSKKNKVLEGKLLAKEEIMELVDAPLEELCEAANEIRKHFCGNVFDLCTIINGKSGRCSEDCKYCAQSSFYHTDVETYPLLSTGEIVKAAKYNEAKGVLRFSIVTSGKKLSRSEVEEMAACIREIKKETNSSVCTSFGLLREEEFRMLKEAGVERIHNNLESSKEFFKKICSTHTFDDKVEAIKAAQKAGLRVCSGGIMGLSESMEDRIDMAVTIRELGVRSIPVNVLNPIAGTPYEKNPKLSKEEVCRIVAIYRFILPDGFIRLAGGRGLLPDKGRQCFISGANAAITGDMLTTAGISIDEDKNMLAQLGYEVTLVEK